MSTSSHLINALSAVDWTKNIQSFGSASDVVARVEACNRRLAIWSRQFEACDARNPALPFVREIQVQGHYAAALIGLALYKPSAAAIRALVESALYYSYFRTHPAELATLVRESNYFVQKSDIIDYHIQHTARFAAREQKLGLLSRLNTWYRSISALVHGQVPGGWISHTSLAGIAYNEETLHKALAMFEEGEYLTHSLFLCTVGQDLWSDFDTKSKKDLLKELSGDVKAELGLTAA